MIHDLEIELMINASKYGLDIHLSGDKVFLVQNEKQRFEFGSIEDALQFINDLNNN